MANDLDERRKRLEQKKARLQAEDARLKEKERRRDARIKIIVGGGLLKLARDGDAVAIGVLGAVLEGAAPREKRGPLAELMAEFPPPSKSEPAQPAKRQDVTREGQ